MTSKRTRAWHRAQYRKHRIPGLKPIDPLQFKPEKNRKLLSCRSDKLRYDQKIGGDLPASEWLLQLTEWSDCENPIRVQPESMEKSDW